jgi:hypothetical protein
MHEDVGMSGDRGDFYRRKLAEQIFLNFGISGVNHTNVMVLVESAINLSCCHSCTRGRGKLETQHPVTIVNAVIKCSFNCDTLYCKTFKIIYTA